MSPLVGPSTKHPCRCAICMAVRELLTLLKAKGVSTKDVTTAAAKGIAGTFAEGHDGSIQCSRVWQQMVSLTSEIYGQQLEAVSWQGAEPTGHRLN